MLFVISSICLVIISVTMLARANDLRWRKGLHWNARLLGFILTGFAPVGVIAFDWITGNTTTFYETLMHFGLMLVFVTTPYLPPWWKWISGKESAPYIDRRNSP